MRPGVALDFAGGTGVVPGVALGLWARGGGGGIKRRRPYRDRQGCWFPRAGTVCGDQRTLTRDIAYLPCQFEAQRKPTST